MSSHVDESQVDRMSVDSDERENEAAGPEENENAKEDKPVAPDPEVLETAKRRRYSANYKLRILREADACTEKGAVGALLRREGLYSSHLSSWRRQRERGSLEGLAPKKRGRKPTTNRKSKRETQLERENRRLRKKLEQAEAIIDIQKKVSALLGIPLESDENT
jgi:transposase-like protein